MQYTDDPLADFHEHERRMAEREARIRRMLPKCESCGKRITEDYYYDVFDVILCEDCIQDKFRKENDVLL